MKIAFIYPFDRNLGNSYYSESYIQALKNHVEIVPLDSRECTLSPHATAQIANSCDLAHVQYEPNFFQYQKINGYERFIKLLTIPKIVSLHEVYKTQPNIYPREEIRGNCLTKPLKLMLYDVRHPMDTIFRKHRRCGHGPCALRGRRQTRHRRAARIEVRKITGGEGRAGEQCAGHRQRANRKSHSKFSHARWIGPLWGVR